MDIDAYFAEQEHERSERAALARRNKRVLAERLNWPDGALETCERLEDENPGWSVFWARENNAKGFERPTGFIATRDGRTRTQLTDPDPDHLEDSIKLMSGD